MIGKSGIIQNQINTFISLKEKKKLHFFLIVLMLSATVHADTGFYVGGDVGFSWTDNPTEIDGLTHQAESDAVNASLSLSVDDDLSSMSQGLFGGYWVKDYLAIEAGYARVIDGNIAYRFDNASNKMGNIGISTDIDRLSISLLPFYELSERLDIYGRIGYAGSTAKIELSDALLIGEINHDNYVVKNKKSTGMLVGLGFRFHPNDHYYLRVEGQYDDSLYGLMGIVMGFGFQF